MSKFDACRKIIANPQQANNPKPTNILKLTAVPSSKPQPVICPHCGFTIFDNEVIRSRCVKPIDGTAKCRCKQWVNVPIIFSQ